MKIAPEFRIPLQLSFTEMRTMRKGQFWAAGVLFAIKLDIPNLAWSREELGDLRFGGN
jgi:hypothetical protein